jgi:hypothetical protein
VAKYYVLVPGFILYPLYILVPLCKPLYKERNPRDEDMIS